MPSIGKAAAEYIDRKWDGFPNWNFHAASGSKEPYAKLPASPWGNELEEALAEQAIVGEKLGQRDATDLLTVSFSSNDYVGHAAGPCTGGSRHEHAHGPAAGEAF